jgi:hypothetical protein
MTITPDHDTTGPVFNTDNLPDGDGWEEFRKTAITHMTRIDGPFNVETIHQGVVTCEDGWLAIDAQGYPYPIAAEEQALIYEPFIPVDESVPG